MSRIVVTGAIGILVLMAGIGLAPAQQPPASQPPAQPGISLQQFMDSTPPRPADSITREDLRNLPSPAIDRLPQAVRVNVMVGDPRCVPGEDLFDTPRPRLPSRRH
jgi:hypothetical protein